MARSPKTTMPATKAKPAPAAKPTAKTKVPAKAKTTAPVKAAKPAPVATAPETFSIASAMLRKSARRVGH